MLRRHYSNSTITCSNNNNNNNNNTLNNTSNNKNPNQKLQHQQRSIERTRSESTTTATTASRTTRSTSTSSPCSSSDSSSTCTFETNLLSCDTTTTTKSNNAFDTAITTNNTTTNNSTIDSNIHIDNRSENNRTMRNRSFLLPSSYHTKTSSSTATTIPGKRNNTNMSSTTATTTTSISDHDDQQQKQQQQQQQQQQLYYSDHPAYNNNNKHNKMNKNSFMVPSIPDDADVAAGQKLLLYEQYNNNSNNNNNNNTNVVIDTNDYFPYHNNNNNTNDALSDTSGELRRPFLIDSAPSSTDTINTINTIKGHPTELEFFEDLITDPVLVLGIDITHMNKNTQFIVCATGVFCFSLLYGYLQELLSVELCSRQLGLFLAVVQFTGYTSLAYVLRNFVYEKTKKRNAAANELRRINSNVSTLSLDENSTHAKIQMNNNNNNNEKDGTNNGVVRTPSVVPLKLYLGLSLLRAVDLAMTNLAMQYINYPAKTLMKSSRIVFTMLFGVLIQRKKYKTIDYVIVAAMVGGLALFMHADANSDAVFHHMGVIMLTVSLICDGAISNMSESIMSTFGIGQDEFIFRMYSIALLAITAAAGMKGDLKDGLYWMTQPGTYAQYVSNAPIEERTWSVGGKVLTMVLFSSMGFFGSSCSAAITKNFGALTMSITSTARKATTLFLSFFLFNNVCTTEHIAGIVLFISALTTKSLRRRNKDGFGSSNKKQTSTNVNIKGHHLISQHTKVHPTININKPSNTSSSSSNTNSSGIMGSLIEVIRPNRVTRRTFSERRGDKNNKNNNNNTKSAPLPSSNNNMHTSLLHVV